LPPVALEQNIAEPAVRLDPAQQQVYFETLLDECVRPHRDAVAEIIQGDGIAAVLFRASPRVQQAARAMGWDGAAPVFRLSDDVRAKIAAGSEAAGDAVTASWMRAVRPGRIFVIAHDGGTWLLNFSPETGYSLEPNEFRPGGAPGTEPGKEESP